MATLFDPITRDERQQVCISKWKANKGRATIEACTGFGKTRIGTKVITAMVKTTPQLKVLIIVPTTTLKDQWEGIIQSLGYSYNCQVEVINTAIKYSYTCDLLIIDELHRVAADTFSTVFDVVKYKFILGLTATIERLDGKHIILSKYCPVVDQVTLLEAMANGWVAPYKEYQVIIDVPNIEDYRQIQKEFNQHFEFFNYDFGEIMKMVGPKGFVSKIAYRDKICNSSDKLAKSEALKNITIHAAGFMRTMQAKKAFINNHPKKIEIAKKIIEGRPNSKIITFSNNVKMAESIGIGKVYSGKDSKKKGRITLDEIREGKERILNTCTKANEGLDMPGLSVAIMLGIDSSKIKAVQRVGRVVRFEEGKQAEIFNIVIADTVESEWFKKSHAGSDYITIGEDGLDAVLKGEEPKPYRKKVKDFTFRF